MTTANLQEMLADTPEILADYEVWGALLARWNERINLVSRKAVQDFWGRHALDSWQLWPLVPEAAESFIDLGSGAGFPGVALAIACKHRGRGRVLLVESAGKKANFLRTVIRELGLPAEVWAARAEKIASKPYDIVSARAFAPLPKLLGYSKPFWGQDTKALLLKGQTANDELTNAEKEWKFDVEKIPSRSEELGVILSITNLQAR